MAGTEWLDDYRRRVADVGVRARQVRDELAGISETASAGSGAVTVTVDARGAPQQLSFGPRADELSRPALAAAVLEAIRRARTAAAQRSAAVLEPLVGGTEAARFLAAHRPAACDPAERGSR
ncbi:MAG TPA: YbaB/EbfC family nucleoid-associated protein [Pseudonocardia sp.]|jgi:DNA-binding protein YbaB